MSNNHKACNYCGAVPTVRQTKTQGTKITLKHEEGCADMVWILFGEPRPKLEK